MSREVKCVPCSLGHTDTPRTGTHATPTLDHAAHAHDRTVVLVVGVWMEVVSVLGRFLTLFRVAHFLMMPHRRDEDNEMRSESLRTVAICAARWAIR